MSPSVPSTPLRSRARLRNCCSSDSAQNGVAYVVTGGGGRGTCNVGRSALTAFSAEVIHFVYLEVSAEELVLHAIDATGRELDSMVVPRE
jgi:hypothetical protein